MYGNNFWNLKCIWHNPWHMDELIRGAQGVPIAVLNFIEKYKRDTLIATALLRFHRRCYLFNFIFICWGLKKATLVGRQIWISIWFFNTNFPEKACPSSIKKILKLFAAYTGSQSKKFRVDDLLLYFPIAVFIASHIFHMKFIFDSHCLKVFIFNFLFNFVKHVSVGNVFSVWLYLCNFLDDLSNPNEYQGCRIILGVGSE